MSAPEEARRERGTRDLLVVLAGASLAGTILIAVGPGRRPAAGDTPEEGRGLTRPLRLEVTSPGAFREFLLALRVHHYRPQPQGESVYRDVYLDTGDGTLARRHSTFRFREKLQGGGQGRYSVRLTQEPSPARAQPQDNDVASDLDDGTGEAIVAGDWPRAATGASDPSALERLRAVLDGLGVEAARLEPRLVGEVRRQRFDVTDKGQTWFTVDHEVRVVRPFPASEGAEPVR